MADDKAKTQRRVYVLPTELVDRMVAYQQEMGLASEVETARRLLDEALKHHDTALSITRRFQDRLKETRLLADIAKDVLIGHPLLSTLRMELDRIEFTLTRGDQITVHADGRATIVDPETSWPRNLDKDGIDRESVLNRDSIRDPGI
ncbi:MULTISPECIES: hypothetical protein [unclassified Mesorhizobium]|uniref:hypothetical protein n=1 Tax=unclassified Mesorhizobium TaxID=325217 RepID=UPI000FCA893B|nr:MULTISPECIES: hypothetical protein [unclassified Mesorhizobium]TGP24893.1 hypothetical protein EN874_007120 [Mesorhizobium sp. M1D.F.Ca.ET.231.01.1.1]TGP36216.1 hypothetical protein EN877_07120 [Mesorhizobium sp. M1D.F.Ca.ET.234.01.1.1]TGS49718.1 hypothetical protein EN827_07120 [Mesorhizobium sp. M1D.F.Ca.ET.184.01.1.1]TGS64430.1 hypothetical protein EN826_007120 [Mesorhizobium sp. M1D.F.Ca.ET.183.01.1.1]